MKKVFIVLILSAFLTPVFSQETAKVETKPVRNTFGTGILIDNQTIATPYKGGIELEIHHRFSAIENIHNLYGIYGSANTRIGLNYGVTDRLMIGLGTTKDYQLQDLQIKYLILQQTEDGKMPVSLSFYGNMVADLRTEDAFGPSATYKSIHRLSYFSQLILARKFGERISVQIAPAMAYFNSVPKYQLEGDTTSAWYGSKNMNFGISAGIRANIVGAHSLMVEYDQLFTKQDLGAGMPKPKPNLAFGWEIGTGTHTFQLFVTKYNQIINQRNLVFNTNGKYLVGFNVTVRF
jgi:hypothetical protein